MKNVGIMDRILVFIAVLLLVFTAAMIVIYVKTGGIPDTLCTCVFSVCGGECGVMGWIKTNKDKQCDREYEPEDKNDLRQDAEEEEA